ncbi:MAG: hypothetical protein CVV02_08470 [Firmicutes bacterium HGW-Firmicutes-7]|nr:MAG: hypothetical protein CVV02_08470 [Firmicutes bacterium HGW-Firmicutes-7]
MKYKVIKDKKSGDTRIDYFKVPDRKTFRYNTLKKLLQGKDLIIRIDTNLVKTEAKDIDISKMFEEYFEANNISHEVLPTESNKNKKILGISLKANHGNAYIILFSIKEQDMTEEFFDQYLDNCDLEIGISPNKSVEDIYKEMKKGYLTCFFGSEYFEGVIYDSNFVESMRVSKGIEVNLT